MPEDDTLAPDLSPSNDWEFFYDESGRLTRCERPDGTSIQYRWDGDSVDPPLQVDADGYLDLGGGGDV